MNPLLTIFRLPPDRNWLVSTAIMEIALPLQIQLSQMLTMSALPTLARMTMMKNQLKMALGMMARTVSMDQMSLYHKLLLRICK